jgi:hypothetical protein
MNFLVLIFISYLKKKGEFLLNCQGDLGMFATYNGQTTRPPIAWSTNEINKFEIMLPYIICLGKDLIQVYNLEDCKLKQEINMPHVKLIYQSVEEEFFIVSTRQQVYALTMISSQLQVEQLFQNNQCDEAIQLFQYLNKRNNDRKKFANDLIRIKIKAAFTEILNNQNYSKANELFIQVNLNYLQVTNCSLFNLKI